MRVRILDFRKYPSAPTIGRVVRVPRLEGSDIETKGSRWIPFESTHFSPEPFARKDGEDHYPRKGPIIEPFDRP